MNDDLISRSKLIEDIEKIHINITGLRSGKSVLADMLEQYAAAVKKVIKEQPTAFDVDRVMGVIAKEIRKCNAELYVDVSTEPTFNLPTVIAKRQALNEALDIVKAGGIDVES